MTATLSRPDAPDVTPPDPPKRSRGELGALAALLAGTGLLYLWNLGASGYANSFYAAAVQAGTKNWEALLFGSLDAGNTVTVDKPPAAMWVMGLSGRIFGFSSWSMLVPEALMGVATVALVYAAVRRVAGPRAGLLAGAVMALTPVAVLMFRFNNPDALLVLLMVAAAYATVRACEKAGTRWLVLAGVLIGFAFLAKMGQALIVVPGLALAYLVCAPTGLWHRIRQLLYAGVAIVVSAGWYVALTELWPAASRPYIGGSQGNSLLQLALGYNGFSRIFGGGGNRGGAPGGGFPGGALPGGGAPGGGFPGGGPGGGGFGGAAGIGRLFSGEIGGQVSWLLPAALALLVAGLWLTRRAPRTDPLRASLVLWGGWTVVTWLVFSFAEGTFHPYYTVALAPGIAALVGVGGHELWRHRASWPGRAALAVVVGGTAVWAWVLLDRSATFLPWLRWVVLAVAVIAVIALLLPGRRLLGAAAAAVVITGVAGPAAYAVDTAVVPHTGSIPSAGPSTGGGGFPGGGLPGAGRAGRGAGGPGEEAAADPALDALLRSAGTTWSAATVGAMGGDGLALTSGTDVMTIGGFSGSDPAPTLAQFQADVAAGRIHYFVEGGGGFGGGGAPNLDQVPQSVRDTPQFQQFLEQGGARGGFGGRGGTGSEITTWVQQHYTSSTVGGRTVYDLTKPK